MHPPRHRCGRPGPELTARSPRRSARAPRNILSLSAAACSAAVSAASNGRHRTVSSTTVSARTVRFQRPATCVSTTMTPFGSEALPDVTAARSPRVGVGGVASTQPNLPHGRAVLSEIIPARRHRTRTRTVKRAHHNTADLQRGVTARDPGFRPGSVAQRPREHHLGDVVHRGRVAGGARSERVRPHRD